MNHKFLLPLIFFALLQGFPLFSQQSDGEGERLILLAAEDLSAGDYTGALEKYREAAPRLSGVKRQLCQLRILQIKWDMGQYENLPAEALPLTEGGLEPSIVRGALIIEIKSLIRLGREKGALELMEDHNRLLTGEPSAALCLSDAYRTLGREDDARRVEWIIKRDFPQSPEGLILTGRAERRTKPSLLFP